MLTPIEKTLIDGLKVCDLTQTEILFTWDKLPRDEKIHAELIKWIAQNHPTRSQAMEKIMSLI